MIDATDEEEEEELGDAQTVELEDTEKCLSEPTTPDSPPPSSKKCISKLTDGQIVAESVGLMMAGYDTTANALAYTSYLLALHPEIQEKLQSEIDNYLSDKPVS